MVFRLPETPDFTKPEEVEIAWTQLIRDLDLLQQQLNVQGPLETNIVFASTSVYNLRNEGTLLVNASVSNAAIYLPEAYKYRGRCFTVKRLDSAVNTVIVHTSTTGYQTLMDTTVEVTISALASYTFQSNGEQYYIVNKYG